MLLIDRYLLRQFLQSFVICFCSLTGLFIVIDAFGNLDEFVGHGAKHGGVPALLVEYYGYRSLSFFDRTSGILTLISAMFTIAGFQRHHELTALLAAGIPRWRIIRSLIGAVAVISVLAAVSRELVIPAFSDELSRNPQDFEGEKATTFDPRRDNQTDILLRGSRAIAKDKQIEQPSFRLPPGLRDYGNEIVAKKAYYRPPEGDRPGGYLLQGVTEPRNLDQKPSLLIDGQPAIITPLDAAWLAPDECFVVSAVAFDQLVGGANWRQFSSTSELIAGMHNPSLDFGADLRVAIHARFVQPLLDMTLLFLGLPLVLTRESRNMFLAIGLGIAVVAGFMLVVVGCKYLGSGHLISPALAAWCPLMLFVPLAAAIGEPLRQ